MIASSIIAGIAAVIAAVISGYNHRKLNEIHVLVNSRLDAAIGEIEDLKKQRDLKRDDDNKA